jgi:2,3-bisphosphoglycerate-dependent phosphoglycerate mutase
MTYTLILLRHGESTWNALNQFTGWVDVPLSEKGTAEAIRGGGLIADAGVLPDVLHTSLLRRAIMTANLALDAADRHWIPVRRSWRLNERHYGDLQGKNKKQTLDTYGEEQFMLWRRSYDTPPPPISDTNEFSQAGDPRYADLGDDAPKTECLADVVARMESYLYGPIFDDLKEGKTVLVAAHGNSLRAVVKMLDEISDEGIAKVNHPAEVRTGRELQADQGRRRVPGSGGGGRGHHRGGQPGPLNRSWTSGERWMNPEAGGRALSFCRPPARRIGS